MKVRSCLVAAAMAFWSVSSASAQTTAGVNANLEFDFSLPGARSLGMGGAFVSLADDATASQANPAGLTILSKPEISIEGRTWNFYALSRDSGHGLGPATGVGVDTIDGIREVEFKDTTGSPAFISFVYPTQNWAIAAYRHQFSRFRNHGQSNGPFLTRSDGVVGRVDPSVGEIELDIVSYGGSLGFKVSDAFSLGFGVALATFDLESVGRGYLVTPRDTSLTPAQRPQFTGTGQQFGPADFSDANVLAIERQYGSDSAVAFNAGALYKATEKLTFGFSYRRGPRFKFDSEMVGGPAFLRIAPGTDPQLDRDTGIHFNTPDLYAVGATLSPSDRLKLTFEYNRVQYSQLLDGTGDGLPVDSAGSTSSADPIVREEGRQIQQGLRIDDANQARLGMEFVAVKAPRPILLRVGTWYDPAHAVYFDASGNTGAIQRVEQLQLLLPKRDNQMHFSAGAGISFSRFQIDGAFDVSNRVNTVAISAVFYLR